MNSEFGFLKPETAFSLRRSVQPTPVVIPALGESISFRFMEIFHPVDRKTKKNKIITERLHLIKRLYGKKWYKIRIHAL